jgi:hypothetical protein
MGFLDLLALMRDLIATGIIVFGPVPLGLVLARLAGAGGRDLGTVHNWIIVLTAWSVIQVSLVLVLGSTRTYDRADILAAEIALALTGGALLRRFASNLSLISSFVPRGSLSKWELLVVGSTTTAGLIVAGRTLLRPIIDFDSLWHHLPNMAIWYQTGSFGMMSPTGDIVFDQVLRFPFDWEALCSLFLFPMGEDFLVALPKLLAWVLWGLAIYATSARIGATRVHSLCAASLALTIPFVISDVNTLHIDIAFAAFVALAVYFMFCYASSRSLIDLALVVLSMAMVCGIKMSGLVYVPVLTLWFLVLVLADKRGVGVSEARASRRGDVVVFAVAIVLSILVGGFWYFRNLFELGNPLGYVAVSVADTPIFSGPLSAQWLRQTTLTSRILSASDWLTITVQALARLQLPFALLCLQALFLPRALARPHTVRRSHVVCLLVLFAAAVWLYCNSPYSGGLSFQPLFFAGANFRYAFPAIGLLAVLAAIAGTELRTRPSMAAIAVVFASLTGILAAMLSDVVRVSAFMGTLDVWASALVDKIRSDPSDVVQTLLVLARRDLLDVVAGMTIYLAVLVLFVICIWRPRGVIMRFGRHLGQTPGVALALIALLILTPAARYQRDRNRHEVYSGIYDYLEESTRPGEKIAYILGFRSYLFYGKDISRKVVYQPPTMTDSAAWIEKLRKDGVTMLAVGPLDWLSMPERRWIAPGGAFTRVFGDDITKNPVLYRLEPGISDSAAPQRSPQGTMRAAR